MLPGLVVLVLRDRASEDVERRAVAAMNFRLLDSILLWYPLRVRDCKNTQVKRRSRVANTFCTCTLRNLPFVV